MTQKLSVVITNFAFFSDGDGSKLASHESSRVITRGTLDSEGDLVGGDSKLIRVLRGLREAGSASGCDLTGDGTLSYPSASLPIRGQSPCLLPVPSSHQPDASISISLPPDSFCDVLLA